MRDKRNLIYYLIGIIVSILLSFYIIDFKVSPKAEDCFGILIDSFDISIKEEQLNLPDNIKKTSIKNSTGTDLSIFVTAQSQSKDYDILILNEVDTKSDKFYHALLPLKESDIHAAFPNDFSYLVKDEVIYGLDITSQLIKYASIPISNTYYACFLLNSVHSGLLNNCESDLSISVLKDL